MNELVFLKSKTPLTTSLKVAETFEKPHKDILEKIRLLSAEISADVPIEGFNPKFVASTYKDVEGREQPIFLLNRDAFTELVSNLNGKKARVWKRKYHAAFNAMEQMLLQQQNEQWREIRAAGKVGNRSMCDAIHDVIIPLAREQGSAAPEKVFYWNYQKAVNKAAGVKPNSRDELPLGQLYEIEKLQHIVEVSIKGLAARGDGYKQIYQNTNQTLENYSRLSLITERFLTA